MMMRDDLGCTRRSLLLIEAEEIRLEKIRLHRLDEKKIIELKPKSKKSLLGRTLFCFDPAVKISNWEFYSSETIRHQLRVEKTIVLALTSKKRRNESPTSRYFRGEEEDHHAARSPDQISANAMKRDCSGSSSSSSRSVDFDGTTLGWRSVDGLEANTNSSVVSDPLWTFHWNNCREKDWRSPRSCREESEEEDKSPIHWRCRSNEMELERQDQCSDRETRSSNSPDTRNRSAYVKRI